MNVCENGKTKAISDWFIHPGHFILHGFNIAFVFTAGVFADLYILDYVKTKPHEVRWQNGEVQKDFLIRKQSLPPDNTSVQLGMTDDGTIVWRQNK